VFAANAKLRGRGINTHSFSISSCAVNTTARGAITARMLQHVGGG
jgi:hypothetical protein